MFTPQRRPDFKYFRTKRRFCCVRNFRNFTDAYSILSLAYVLSFRKINFIFLKEIAEDSRNVLGYMNTHNDEIADPGVASLIPVRSHTFVEIDHEILSTVILLPSAESFSKGCQLQAKVSARSTGWFKQYFICN